MQLLVVEGTFPIDVGLVQCRWTDKALGIVESAQEARFAWFDCGMLRWVFPMERDCPCGVEVVLPLFYFLLALAAFPIFTSWWSVASRYGLTEQYTGCIVLLGVWTIPLSCWNLSVQCADPGLNWGPDHYE